MTEKIRKNKIAWSDDLSYDSEEEREKERLALAELAEIEAPEKPSYTDDELNKLVSNTQQLTTLRHLQKNDWNEECLEIIKQYFMEPKNIILCIYFHKSNLMASLGIPDEIYYDMTYFLRQPDMIYSVENFYNEIMFGTIVESIEDSLLKALEFVYAPILQTSNSLPNNIKHRLNMEIHDLLAKLTDRHNKLVGKTIIYVPRECCNKSVDDASSNKELVKRLESIVIHWIRQLKCAIEDSHLVTFQQQLICPLDELSFMYYRYENLRGLKYQIESDNVIHITKILKNAHSSYIQQFDKLYENLTKKLEITKSNIEYLQIFKEPCMLMETASLSDLPTYIYLILHKFRFIWMESPHYNTKEKLTKLLTYLSNQIIIQCSVSINLDQLFDGKTKTAMEEILKCIDCCKNYKDIYKTVSETHNEMYHSSWDLDMDIIFNYIDSFIQRCFDMLEVCNGMLIFGRINEEETIEAPQFGGAKGEEFEKECKHIEKTFSNALMTIKDMKENIFNVQNTEWCKAILKFRITTKHIEILIENLMASLFNEINNVEESIQTLNATLNYLKRGNLKNCLSKTVSQVWKTLSQDIELIKHEIVNEKQNFLYGMPFYSGQALQFQFRTNLLFYNKKIIDLALWMPQCHHLAGVIHEYNKIVTIIQTSTQNIQDSWNITNEKINLDLNKYIICYSSITTGLLECNFDRDIMMVFKEICHWENWQLATTPDLTKIYPKINEAKLIYEEILDIVTGFNRIINSLLEEEQALFKPLIIKSMSKIREGIFIHTWLSSDLEEYLTECGNSVTFLQQNIDEYKYYNMNTIQLLETACNNSWIKYNEFHVSDASSLSNHVKNSLNSYFFNLTNVFKDVIKFLTKVYQIFKEDIENIMKHWVKYINYLDALLENVIVFNARNSFQNMLKNIAGDGTIGSLAMLNVDIYLENQQLKTNPRFQDVYEIFYAFFKIPIDHFKLLPRLGEIVGVPNKNKKFNKVIENDPECQMFKKLTLNGVAVTLEKAKEHLKGWSVFDHVWKVPKDAFFNEYISHKPSLKEFDKDIIRYIDIASEVQLKEYVVQVDFLIINLSRLKSSVIEECTLWQENFKRLSTSAAQNNIANLYESVKHSYEIKHQSNTLVELQELVDAYDKLCAEIEENRKKKFGAIENDDSTVDP